MRMSKSFRANVESVVWQLVAFVALVTMLPALLSIGLLLRTNSDEPVLLKDEVLARDGTRVRIHRLRTTGRGTNAFRAIGRFVRSIGYDDLPGLWEAARGQIDLMQFYHLNRSK
jgi:lipopolysaccharide/colanic/teichoic acid biosynthesis glycosyltransferase